MKEEEEEEESWISWRSSLFEVVPIFYTLENGTGRISRILGHSAAAQ